MAEITHFGVESETCLDPDGVGCSEPVSAHAQDADGCSYFGAGGWCDCLWYPQRTGAALLLEHSVIAKLGLTAQTPERTS